MILLIYLALSHQFWLLHNNKNAFTFCLYWPHKPGQTTNYLYKRSRADMIICNLVTGNNLINRYFWLLQPGTKCALKKTELTNKIAACKAVYTAKTTKRWTQKISFFSATMKDVINTICGWLGWVPVTVPWTHVFAEELKDGTLRARIDCLQPWGDITLIYFPSQFCRNCFMHKDSSGEG